MRRSNAPAVLSGLLSGLGALVLLSLLLHLTGRSDGFALPGRFLFTCFLWAAFFVPAYLLAAALLLASPAIPRRALVPLSLLNLPFLTLGLFFQVLLLEPPLASPLAAGILELLGRFAGVLVLLLLTTLEVLLVLRIGQALSPLTPAPGEGGLPGRGASARKPSPDPRTAAGRRPPDPRPDIRPPRRASPSAGDPRPEGPPAEGAPAGGAPPALLPLNPPALLEEPRAQEAVPPEPDVWVQAEAAEEVEELPPVSGEAGTGPGEAGTADPTGDPAHASAPAEEKPSGVREKTRGPRMKAAPGGYTVPVDGLLKDYPDADSWRLDEETRKAAAILTATLEEFKIQAEVTGTRKGPVITMFEILPAPGVKISRIVNLADNIALRLAASRVRIVAPIPGKHAVGIEVPNRHRSIVSFKEIADRDEFKKHTGGIPVILGKDITGEPQVIDLTHTPHLLIAGATGSGKSVCVNSIICSILYSRSPDEVRFLLVDPKIVELKLYNDVPHLLTPVITEPKKTFQAIQYCLSEMERRYHLLDALGVRDIRSYNRKVPKARMTAEKLPYIVVVVDEFADLIAITGKEMESALARLAAMSRAVGIHLVLATQRPSIDVITGLIKANIPSRIAFMVAGKFDSRIIIDAVGAEKLLGQGDMLFSSAWNPFPVRIQGSFLSEEEVESITTYMKSLGTPEYIDDEIFFEEEEDGGIEDFGVDDPLLQKALEIVMAKGNASASYLQRRLKVGYNRAARLVELMENRGIVGPANGSKPREILHVPDRQ